jgi:hypothetical protein
VLGARRAPQRPSAAPPPSTTCWPRRAKPWPALFAHTASWPAAREPGRAGRGGDAFGRWSTCSTPSRTTRRTQAAGAFNPLRASGTAPAVARAVADALVADVQRALGQAELEDPALVDVLLGKELRAAVQRAFPVRLPVPQQREAGAGSWAAAVAALSCCCPPCSSAAASARGGCGPRRRRYRMGGYPVTTSTATTAPAAVRASAVRLSQRRAVLRSDAGVQLLCEPRLQRLLLRQRLRRRLSTG